LLETSEQKAAAITSTRLTFGALDAGGILIPFQDLIFLKPVATGSFGRVIEGKLRGSDERVAIKELNDTVRSRF
jgi:hypothetical protein